MHNSGASRRGIADSHPKLSSLFENRIEENAPTVGAQKRWWATRSGKCALQPDAMVRKSATPGQDGAWRSGEAKS